jgi:hypothetical protein
MSGEGIMESLLGSPPDMDISAMPWEAELPELPRPR